MSEDELELRAGEGAAMGLDELVAYALDVEAGVLPGAHPEAGP